VCKILFTSNWNNSLFALLFASTLQYRTGYRSFFSLIATLAISFPTKNYHVNSNRMTRESKALIQMLHQISAFPFSSYFSSQNYHWLNPWALGLLIFDPSFGAHQWRQTLIRPYFVNVNHQVPFEFNPLLSDVGSEEEVSNVEPWFYWFGNIVCWTIGMILWCVKHIFGVFGDELFCRQQYVWLESKHKLKASRNESRQ